MEFILHNELLETIKPLGMQEVTARGLTRFILKPTTAQAWSPRTIQFGIGESDRELDPPGDGSGGTGVSPIIRVVSADADALPSLIDSIIHKEHLNEVALFPATEWRPIVDQVAFDLAGDEHWNDIDAEAALHLHSRDPLLVESKHIRLVKKIAASVLAGGTPGAHDFSIVALGAPLVMNFEQRGRLTVWCSNDAMADVVARLVSRRTNAQ